MPLTPSSILYMSLYVFSCTLLIVNLYIEFVLLLTFSPVYLVVLSMVEGRRLKSAVPRMRRFAYARLVLFFLVPRLVRLTSSLGVVFRCCVLRIGYVFIFDFLCRRPRCLVCVTCVALTIASC